jgi:cytochrome c-type biogenesis protein CcmH/NrfG
VRRLALLFVVALSIFSPLPLGAGQGPRASFAQEIAISADAAQPPDPNDVLAQYLEAVRLREAGAVDAAVEAMERVHALAPDDPDLTLELARTYEAARLYGHAAAAYAEAAMIAPTRADLALAQAHFHLDHAFRVRDALLAAEHAARLRPDDPEVIQLLDRARTAALLADS